MDIATYKAYVDILKEELIPAMGCTEPIAVAYAAAIAADRLGVLPEKVIIKVSPNILKNVKSGFADAASLDETVIFNYDRTINQSELSNATVTLGGEELSKEKYEISSIGNKVMVSLKDLAMGAKYKIGLSGVSDVISKTNGDVAEFEFETADNDIVATKPTLDGTVLSTKVNSYYANGKAIKLIVAVYNSEETMVEAVQVAEVVADDRAGETLSHDFKDILENTEDKTVKGFVWSDFGTMTPYAEAYINN